MNDSITIHKAEKENLNDILEIENLCFDVDKFNKRQFTYLLSKAIFYVAKEAHKIVGYMILLTSVRSKKLRLYSIAVHPDARGKSVGQVLLHKAFELGDTLQRNCITLEVRETNTAAIHLYKKNGFIREGTKYQYYVDGANAAIMHYYLRNKAE